MSMRLKPAAWKRLTVHFIEWLAEWGRQIRRRQRGLLLLTAHSAKGLEFDHVIVLDGGWKQPGGGNSDADEERRLYYVAMTRAKKTLALACVLRNPINYRNALLRQRLSDTPRADWTLG